MIAGIIGVPSRQEIIEDLLTLIRPSVDHVEVFMDTEYRGNFWNVSRAYKSLISRGKQGEPVLITTDDAITVPNWRERWEAIHNKAQNDIYCLFNRRSHLFTPDNVNRGYVTKCQYGGYYDVASIFIDNQTLMEGWQTWHNQQTATGSAETESYKIKRIRKHFDVSIQEYLISLNKPWTIATPTLFDHRPGPSTIGHSIPGSPYYVGGENRLKWNQQTILQ